MFLSNTLILLQSGLSGRHYFKPAHVQAAGRQSRNISKSLLPKASLFVNPFPLSAGKSRWWSILCVAADASYEGKRNIVHGTLEAIYSLGSKALSKILPVLKNLEVL